MLGIDRISWGEFIKLIFIVLTIWYGAVLLYALFRQNSKKQSLFYEGTDTDEGFNDNGLQPVRVSSGAFPSGLIPYPNENIPLEVVYYEETGQEEGYIIDEFTNPGSPTLSAILKKIQFQK